MSIVERKTEIIELNENIEKLTKAVEEGSNKITAAILSYAENERIDTFPLEEYVNFLNILKAKEDE